VRHGVLAGRAEEARKQVYVERILRGTGDDGFYSRSKLGAISQDLGAVAAFFDEPWTRVTTAVSEPDRAWLLHEAAFLLRALGRLTEALGPMRAGLEMAVQQQDWANAARGASSLSELEVTLGDLPAAIRDARASVLYADRSGDAFLRMVFRATTADALHQAGQRPEAGALFAAAEVMQRERQPQFPLLYSMRGFKYCDWLLAPAERAAWRVLLSFPRAGAGAGSADFQSATGAADVQSASGGDANAAEAAPDLDPLAACDEVDRRAVTTLGWAQQFGSLLDIALDHLTLARVAQWRALLTGAAATPAPARDPDQPPDPHAPALTAAVTGLREAEQKDELPKALLTAALSHALRGDPAAARALLDEAWGIAEGGPMPLFQADVLLTRARLWLARPWADPSSRLEAEPAPSRPEAAPTGYPWPERTPALDLAEARRLIEHTGYARRLPELADAEAALRAADA
jgi:tetratricopeptide (TPR) repeat protein